MSADSYDKELEDLELSRGIRKKIISKIVQDDIPINDEHKMKVLTDTLNSLDKASLGRMKIKSEDKGSKALASASGIVAEFLSKVSPNNAKNRDDNLPVPILGDDVPKPKLIDGETEIGTKTFNYDQFSQEHFKKLD